MPHIPAPKNEPSIPPLGTTLPADSPQALQPTLGSGEIPLAQKPSPGPSAEPKPQEPTKEQLDVWLAGLEPELRPVATRHGFKLYVLCINICIANQAMGQLSNVRQMTIDRFNVLKSRQSAAGFAQAIQSAMQLVSLATNNLAEGVRLETGMTKAQIKECVTDIQHAMALRNAQPQANKSGIIVPN